MLATYVAAQKTPLSFEAAARAMQGALSQPLGREPSLPVLALALAKTAFETARWQSIWNHNWGNVKAGENYEGAFTCYACNEVLSTGLKWFIPEGELDRKGGTVVGKVWLVPPGHPQTRFRAYADPADGAHRYVEFVSGGRYRVAFERLLQGDAQGYVHELKLKGYFTADEATYTRGVVSLQNEFIRSLERLGAPEVPAANREEVAEPSATDLDTLLRVEATAAATEARFDELERLRHSALDEMLGKEPDTPPSEPNGVA